MLVACIINLNRIQRISCNCKLQNGKYKLFLQRLPYLQNCFGNLSMPMAFYHDYCTCSSRPLTEFLAVQQYITTALQTANTQVKCSGFSLDQVMVIWFISALAHALLPMDVTFWVVIISWISERLAALMSTILGGMGSREPCNSTRWKNSCFVKLFFSTSSLTTASRRFRFRCRIWYGWNTIL